MEHTALLRPAIETREAVEGTELKIKWILQNGFGKQNDGNHDEANDHSRDKDRN